MMDGIFEVWLGEAEFPAGEGPKWVCRGGVDVEISYNEVKVGGVYKVGGGVEGAYCVP